jgi:arabinogalactan oligomer/maltooligosaccharide transport system permease protein
MHRPRPLETIATHLGLLLLAAFVLVPVWGLVYLAFDGGIRGWPTTFRVWPEQPTLSILHEMWQRPGQSLTFLGALRNSLLVSGGAAILSLAFGASMAYAFARFRFPGRRAGLFALLVGSLLPPVALMVPLYMLLTLIGLRTTLLGLTIVYASFSMPFCIWNMRAAFQSVSLELEEAAFLDGASPLRAFLSISLPLALPAIAVAALVAFLIGYSEFALGWLFVESSSNVTLAMAISGIFTGGTVSWSRMAALSLLMCAPVIAIFFALQRHLLRGLVVGQAGD